MNEPDVTGGISVRAVSVRDTVLVRAKSCPFRCRAVQMESLRRSSQSNITERTVVSLQVGNEPLRFPRSGDSSWQVGDIGQMLGQFFSKESEVQCDDVGNGHAWPRRTVVSSLLLDAIQKRPSDVHFAAA